LGSSHQHELTSTSARFGEFVVRRMVVLILAWRAFATPIVPFALVADGVPVRHWRTLWILIGVLVLQNGVLAAVGWHGLPRLLHNRAFLLGDMTVTVLVNLWATTLMPHQQLAAPNRDVLTMYMVSGVALWTALRGAQFGLFALSVAALMETAMMVINGLPLGTFSWIIPGARVAWIGGGFGAALVGRILIREGVKLVTEESHELGKRMEQMRLLAQFHDTVLNALQYVSRVVDEADLPADERLARVAPVVRRQVGELRRVLERINEDEETGEFYEGLCQLAIDFEARTGVNQEVVRLGAAAEPEPETCRALIGAVNAALINVERHAEATNVNLLVESDKDKLRIVLRDDGHGFDPQLVRPQAFGIRNAIIDRLKIVGGDAKVHSAPGAGTKVEFTVPLAGRSLGVSTDASRAGWRVRSRRERDSRTPDRG
jgi:signal transduction histidine kinase